MAHDLTVPAQIRLTYPENRAKLRNTTFKIMPNRYVVPRKQFDHVCFARTTRAENKYDGDLPLQITMKISFFPKIVLKRGGDLETTNPL